MPFRVESFRPEWISDKLDNQAIDFAQQFGEHLCALTDGRTGRAALTTSQIRNFFGEIKRIQNKKFEDQASRSSFLLVRPKLAYAEARVLQKQGGVSRISDFRLVMERAHQAVTDAASFQNFVDFLEAILAFHKFYGGKDS